MICSGQTPYSEDCDSLTSPIAGLIIESIKFIYQLPERQGFMFCENSGSSLTNNRGPTFKSFQQLSG